MAGGEHQGEDLASPVLTDGRDVEAPYALVSADPLQTSTLTFRTGGRPAPHGHPYPATGTRSDAGAVDVEAPRRLFRQGRLLSLEPEGVRPTVPPASGSQLLRPRHAPPQRRRRLPVAPPAHDTAFDRSSPS